MKIINLQTLNQMKKLLLILLLMIPVLVYGQSSKEEYPPFLIHFDHAEAGKYQNGKKIVLDKHEYFVTFTFNVGENYDVRASYRDGREIFFRRTSVITSTTTPSGVTFQRMMIRDYEGDEAELMFNKNTVIVYYEAESPLYYTWYRK